MKSSFAPERRWTSAERAGSIARCNTAELFRIVPEKCPATFLFVQLLELLCHWHEVGALALIDIVDKATIDAPLHEEHHRGDE